MATLARSQSRSYVRDAVPHTRRRTRRRRARPDPNADFMDDSNVDQDKDVDKAEICEISRDKYGSAKRPRQFPQSPPIMSAMSNSPLRRCRFCSAARTPVSSAQ